MQKVVNTASWIRTNWKKSVLLAVGGVYGVRWQQASAADAQYMRGLAREALTYGSQTQHVDASNFAVTVVLNPVAGGVKARALYERCCAPLLHLAGLKVSVVRTESDGQAKDIMELMKDADAVLIAGGDGTLMEAVTGLMRRADRAEATKVPLGLLPVGKTNMTAHRLFPGEASQTRLLGDATMAVVRQLKKPVGVIEVENQAVGRSIFAMTGVELGAWKDARLLLSKWFVSFDWVKRWIPQALYGRAYALKQKELLWDCDVEVQYLEQEEVQEVQAEQVGGGLISWITGGVRERRSTSSSTSSSSTWSTPSPHHGAGLEITPRDNQLSVELLPAVNSMEEFTSHGAAVLRGEEEGRMEGERRSTGGVLLTPRMQEGEERRICVDGDDIELSGPLLLSYHRDRLSMYCSEQLAKKEEVRAQPAHGPRWAAVSSITRGRT